MSLPKIIQDEINCDQELIDLIHQRYLTAQASKFNFQSGQVYALNAITKNKQGTQSIQELLQKFINMKVENGYCYYKLRLLQCCEQKNIKQKIAQQLYALSDKKSDYHKINHLILMREVLLSKLISCRELSSESWEWIDDIRFMIEEIVKAVRGWRQMLKSMGVKDTIIYLYKNQNYLTKIIIDNSKILQNLSNNQIHFLKVPNPFFISQGKIDQNLSIKSINQILQHLSQEKALELKMVLESSFAKASKNSALENELVLMRNGIQEQKIENIKTIYQSQKEQMRQTHSKLESLSQQKIDLMTMKNQSSIKNLDKLIKIKEIQVLKDINKRKTIFLSKPQQISLKELKGQPYLSKIESLKANVQRNSKIKKSLPKAQHQIKASKPKIKLFSQNTIQAKNIQKIGKQIQIMNDSRGLLTRSKSTFYKQNNQQEKRKKSDKINMISSTYSSTSIKSRRKGSINIHLPTKYPSSRKGQRQKSKSREQELSEVKDSLALLNRKIRQEAIKNIYSNKQKKSGPEMSGPRIKKDQQKGQTKNKQLIQDFSSPLNTFQDKIKKKQSRIDELKKKLNELKLKNNEELQHEIDAQSLMKNESQGQRQRLQLQNMKIQEQMKKQQLRFLALKEKQYQLRQAEMQKKYAFQLQKIKEQLQLKNKQWQLKIVQQQKKQKQSVSKIQQIRKKSQLAALELQQKEIKQKLIAEIYEEQQIKKQKTQQQDKAKKILQTLRKEQEKYKLELQRKSIESYEQQKLKLSQLYLQMRRKNQALFEQNMKRNQQLQHIQKEKQRQQQSLINLQEEIMQKEKQIKLKQFLSSETNKEHTSISADQIQRQIANQQEQLQQLKERIKEQLIEEIKRKRRQQQQQQKQYEEQRKKHIAQMQEELRRVMKLQEQNLLRIQQEYKIKTQQIIKQHEEQLIISRLQKQKNKEQQEQALKRLQHSQPFQVQTLIPIQTGLENQNQNRLKRSISSASISELQRQKSQFFIQQKKNQPSPLKEKQLANSQQQSKKKEANQVKGTPQQIKTELVQQNMQAQNHIQQIKQNKQSITPNQQQTHLKISQQSPQKPITNEQSSKLSFEQQKLTQTVRQNSQQIRQKYDALLLKISKPTKQIFMPFQQIDTYLNKFYAQLPQEVKQMIPYSRKQVESIFRQKKVDIFDGFSFGLYRPKQRKFTLFGAIECIPLIASKYGQIQIQQVYLFNKNNGYQKQYLSKQMKLFQKIGYIYQKKTADQGIYTIKFIVKIPKQGKKQINLRDQLQIKAILHFEQHSNNQVDLIKNHCIYYMLCRGLSENLTQKQKDGLALQNSIECKYINKKLGGTLLNNNVVKTQIINHNIVEVAVNLPIKYIQTIDQPFFTLQVIQYVIKATEQKIFLALFQQNGIAIVIHQMSHNDVPEGFSLQTFIESKFKRMEKVSQMFIFLPVWQSSKKYYYKGDTPKSFSFIQKTHASLVYGSIVRSKVHKGDFIFLEPPFAFLIFEITSAQVLKRMLIGHIVKPEEVLRMKRTIN